MYLENAIWRRPSFKSGGFRAGFRRVPTGFLRVPAGSRLQVRISRRPSFNSGGIRTGLRQFPTRPLAGSDRVPGYEYACRLDLPSAQVGSGPGSGRFQQGSGEFWWEPGERRAIRLDFPSEPVGSGPGSDGCQAGSRRADVLT